VPKEVDNLIKVAYLKCLCKKAGIISVLQLQEGLFKLQFLNSEMLEAAKERFLQEGLSCSQNKDDTLQVLVANKWLDTLVALLEDVE